MLVVSAARRAQLRPLLRIVLRKGTLCCTWWAAFCFDRTPDPSCFACHMYCVWGGGIKFINRMLGWWVMFVCCLTSWSLLLTSPLLGCCHCWRSQTWAQLASARQGDLQQLLHPLPRGVEPGPQRDHLQHSRRREGGAKWPECKRWISTSTHVHCVNVTV